jgi:hypothetical protein
VTAVDVEDRTPAVVVVVTEAEATELPPELGETLFPAAEREVSTESAVPNMLM